VNKSANITLANPATLAPSEKLYANISVTQDVQVQCMGADL